MAPLKSLIAVLITIGFSNAKPTDPNVIIAQRQETPAPISISTRGFNGGGLASLIDAVWNYLKPNNAYDPIVPDKCRLLFGTEGGGNCQSFINCGDSDETSTPTTPDVWSQCFINGRQYFTDPNIGDYSITFTEAGGVNGNTEDGLHHPILQLANVDNWASIDVQSLSDAASDDGGNLCNWAGGEIAVGYLAWQCGVPKTGTDGAFGISSDTIVHSPGFSPGWCTFHIQQFQRNENGVGATYQFDVVLYDAKKMPIGQIDHMAVSSTGALSMDSNLPYTLDINTGGADDDDVKFAYGGTTWEIAASPVDWKYYPDD